MKLKERFNECIEQIDFDKIYRVMHFIDWQWQGKWVPSIAMMKDTCEHLYKSAKANYKQHWKWYSATWWFEVSIEKDYVSVKFVLEGFDF